MLIVLSSGWGKCEILPKYRFGIFYPNIGLGQPNKKANQPAFGYVLADLPGNVIGAIRLSANDVEVTLSIGMLIDDILARTYLKMGDWITGTGAARASRTGASPGK
jgi:hypothetical protein